MKHFKLLRALLLLSMLTGFGASAEAVEAGAEPGNAEAALNAFQAALKAGDKAAALAWLAPEVLIYEGGGAERSRDEYAAEHLAGDIAFLKAAAVQVLKRSRGGDAVNAWLCTESRLRGKSPKGKRFDLASTETAVLHHAAEGWRIVHLHWSSHDYKAKH